MSEQINTILAGHQERQERLQKIERELTDPELYRQRAHFVALSRERIQLQKTIAICNRCEELQRQLAEIEELLVTEQDSEVLEMASNERKELTAELERTTAAARVQLLPVDERDAKDCIVEIRAGTGGEEASLFAADVFRMYSRYAEHQRWRVSLISSSETEIGGYREIIFSLSGEEVFSRMKYESGVHRVQRVPTTESSGRLHTSAISVAVLPEAEETDIEMKPEELRVDVYRSSGPGGQSVNTTDSAVRITHLPSGLVVMCQDEKSQHKNKAKAMRVLRSRLYEETTRAQREARDSERRSIIGSGDRSERIRTYNFPQNRVSDHRIGLTLHKLDQIMNGELQECIDALRLHDQQQQQSTA